MNTKFISTVLIVLFINISWSCKIAAPGLKLPVDASQLFKDYKENSSKQNKKFQGKEIIVEGFLIELTKNKQNQANIILGSSEFSNGVSCLITNPDVQIKKPLKKGEKLKIKGVCKGFKENVILEKCTILN